LTAPF